MTCGSVGAQIPLLGKVCIPQGSFNSLQHSVPKRENSLADSELSVFRCCHTIFPQLIRGRLHCLYNLVNALNRLLLAKLLFLCHALMVTDYGLQGRHFLLCFFNPVVLFLNVGQQKIVQFRLFPLVRTTKGFAPLQDCKCFKSPTESHARTLCCNLYPVRYGQNDGFLPISCTEIMLLKAT